MRKISSILGYLASAFLVAAGAILLANNTKMLPAANGDGLPETIIFSAGIIFAGLGVMLHQYKQTKATRYLLYSLLLFPGVLHSATFTIRTYPNASISNFETGLLMVFLLLNSYLFYLSYHHRNT